MFKMVFPYIWVIEYKGKKVCIHSISISENFKVDKLSEFEIDLPISCEHLVVDT